MSSTAIYRQRSWAAVNGRLPAKPCRSPLPTRAGHRQLHVDRLTRSSPPPFNTGRRQNDGVNLDEVWRTVHLVRLPFINGRRARTTRPLAAAGLMAAHRQRAQQFRDQEKAALPSLLPSSATAPGCQ
ncbi:hypothetical protein [Streptomyces fradiae]|uniref:hypothetical protein n=1 Tax=Streptomyces fradiae TaxID=1906 RepID=UPI003985A7D5